MVYKVGLLDYGQAGNHESIRRALIVAGAEVIVLTDAYGFDKVDKLVLPGVGSFSHVMKTINDSGLHNVIVETIKRVQTLGICLGMQMMASVGFEHGETKGFDLIDGEVRKMDCNGPVPHLGFSKIEILKDIPLFAGLGGHDEFYFMHSYEYVNYTNVVSLTSYYGHKFVSAVGNGHIFGVQFHPEKSRAAGIRLLKNFIEM